MKMLLLVMIAAFSSGCVVHDHHNRPRHAHHHQRHHKVKRDRACHPSQYWDGHKCRHKGHGHGARKHDGRR